MNQTVLETPSKKDPLEEVECVYCGGPHPSEECEVFDEDEDRKRAAKGRNR